MFPNRIYSQNTRTLIFLNQGNGVGSERSYSCPVMDDIYKSEQYGHGERQEVPSRFF